MLAAAVFVVRAVRTGLGDGMPDGDPSAFGAVLAAATALVVLAAAAMAYRAPRWAAGPLSVALVLEILVLDRYVAPPRLLVALPLLLALALPFGTVAPGGRAQRQAGPPPGSRGRTVLAVAAVLLQLPVGFLYLMSGLVVPAPELFGVYALYAVLLWLTVVLARRRSWWSAAVPPASVGLWYAVLLLGEALLGWQP